MQPLERVEKIAGCSLAPALNVPARRRLAA
jgi:hypothetical protein